MWAWLLKNQGNLLIFFFCNVRQERVKLITLVQLDKLAACEDDMTFFKAGLN